MTIALALRRLAGLMLLWAMVPLPFTRIVQLPFVLAAAAAAIAVAVSPQRAWRPGRAVMNLAAVLIVVVVVAAGGVGVGPLRPLGHLLLLLSAVQVLAVDGRGGFLRAVPGIGLVWLVAVSASTHVTVAPYFALSVVAAWWCGMEIHLLLLADEAGGTAPPAPRLRHATAGAVVAMLLAVPVFVAMPRLASPWVTGYGAHAVTGFSSTVDLGGSGPIQESREVEAIVRLPAGQPPRTEWTRLRGTVLDPVGHSSWAPRRLEFDVVHPAGRRVPLAAGTASRDLTRLEIELLEPRRYLVLPAGTVALESPLPVTVDEAGCVGLAARADGPVRYSVWVADTPPSRLQRPVPRETRLERTDPELADLARSMVGSRTDPAARAAAIEEALQTRFQYSLERAGGRRPDPLRWFLLEGRSGHCEYFAAGMVMLLRELGVPARMVSGYSGGNVAPGAREVIVRGANAHTWVEVWTGPDRGWMTYDPTPQSGVPSLQSRTGIQRLLWAWDWVSLAWDRYVLTFGIGEQVGLLAAAAEQLPRLMAGGGWWRLLAMLAAVVGLIVAVRQRRRRRRRGSGLVRGPAAQAVERLARRLGRSGVEVPADATVRHIGRSACARWPQVGGAVRRLVELAERELYGPAPPNPGVRTEVRRAWSVIHRGAER